MPIVSLACVLKTARERSGLSKRRAAALADIDASALGRIENERRPPTEAQLRKLAEVYGEDAGRLLGLRLVSEIKHKYQQEDCFEECLQILSEEASAYNQGYHE